jgi:hypothetical protein
VKQLRPLLGSLLESSGSQTSEAETREAAVRQLGLLLASLPGSSGRC